MQKFIPGVSIGNHRSQAGPVYRGTGIGQQARRVGSVRSDRLARTSALGAP